VSPSKKLCSNISRLCEVVFQGQTLKDGNGEAGNGEAGTASCRGLTNVQKNSAVSSFVRQVNCRRFCDGRASKDHQLLLTINRATPSYTSQITSNCSISPDFTKTRNLVRDQGGGGSNPLSPTNSFNNLHAILVLPSHRCGRFCRRSCFLNFPPDVRLEIHVDFSATNPGHENGHFVTRRLITHESDLAAL
jgi:hypothetical protein